MKKVILVYDISSDLIECSDRMANDFRNLIGGIYSWIEDDPDGAEYKMVNSLGHVGHWINTDAVLKYLNTKCLKEGEPKARLYKADVDKRQVYADNWAEF